MDEILVAGRHAGAALAAAALAPGRSTERHTLDIATVADTSHDHVLTLDQVLDVVLELRGLDDLGAARIAIGVFRAFMSTSSCAQHRHQPRRGTPGSPGTRRSCRATVLQLFGDLLPLEPGQALQTQLEDGPGLGLGKVW